jgi:hypothetical protein
VPGEINLCLIPVVLVLMCPMPAVSGVTALFAMEIAIGLFPPATGDGVSALGLFTAANVDFDVLHIVRDDGIRKKES